MHDRSVKIHVYNLFKREWGEEELSVKVAFAASENLEAISAGHISTGAVAVKEQSGEQAGVSADHGFAVGKRMTPCEAFLC